MSLLHRVYRIVHNIGIYKTCRYASCKSLALNICNRTNKIFRKKRCANLMIEPANNVRAWLNSFNTIIADGEGVLWIYNKPIPGSIETLNRFREIGKQIYVCTNNSTKTRLQHTIKAESLGLNIHENEMLCTAHATAHYLKALNFLKNVYVIGSEAITTELDAAGVTPHDGIGPDIMQDTIEAYAAKFYKDPNIGAVVVGYDKHFSFCKLSKAVTYLDNPNCLFIATNTDTRSYAADMVIPGTGSFVKAIETCAARKPIIIGKPSGNICEQYIKKGLIKPTTTLVIGDNYQTDIRFGKNLGFQTLMVGTGIHTLTDVLELQKSHDVMKYQFIPDAYIPKLADLNYFLPY